MDCNAPHVDVTCVPARSPSCTCVRRALVLKLKPHVTTFRSATAPPAPHASPRAHPTHPTPPRCLRHPPAARSFLDSIGCTTTKILAKIETRQALLGLNEILKEADGIIMSRGGCRALPCTLSCALFCVCCCVRSHGCMGAVLGTPGAAPG